MKSLSILMLLTMFSLTTMKMDKSNMCVHQASLNSVLFSLQVTKRFIDRQFFWNDAASDTCDRQLWYCMRNVWRLSCMVQHIVSDVYH